MRLSTVLKWVFVLCLLAGIVVSAIRQFFPFGMAGWGGSLAGMFFVTALFSAPALVCAVTMEQGRLRRFLTTGIAASGLALVGWNGYVLVESTLNSHAQDVWLYVLPIPTSWSVFCAVVAMVMRHRLTTRIGMAARWLTIASTAFLAVSIPMMTWYSNAGTQVIERYIKMNAIAAVIAGFGFISTLLAARMKQIVSGADEDVIRLPMRVTCPRCGQRQDMVTAGGSCEQCGLRIMVLVP